MTNLNISIQSQIKNIVESDKEFAVAFDEAWQWLEYSSKGNAKRTLTANFVEGIDYSSLITIEKREIGATRVEEIYLTKDCFKQLAMLSGTEKGKAVRLYYLECEKQLKSVLSGDYLATLKALVSAQEEKQTLLLKAAEAEKKVVELAPKAENWNRLCDSNGTMSIAAVAKNLAIPGMGPNKLFEFLRNKGFLYYDPQGCNIPKAKLCEQGYMKTVEKYDYKRRRSYSVCVVTFKGYSFIVRCLKDAGYLIPDSPTPNAVVLPLPDEIAA